MIRTHLIPTTAAATLMVTVLTLAGCTPTESETRKPAPAAASSNSNQTIIPADSPQLARIRSEVVESTVVPVGNVSAPGKVEANTNRLSRVVLPLTGRITSVLVKIGDFVKQGQPLLTLESGDADAAVSSFQVAQAGVTQARSVLAKAQMDLDRQRDLFEHGAVPQKEVLNTQAITVQAQAALEQSQATREQARRRLQIMNRSRRAGPNRRRLMRSRQKPRSPIG